MDKNKKLYIFSSSKRLTSFQKEIKEGFLYKSYTFGDFLKRVVVVPNKAKIEGKARKIYLREAIAHIDISPIGFEGNFISFLSFSDFIFSFFDELTQAKVSIETLKSFDVYAEYDEHTEILEKCYKAYKNLLLEKNLYDSCTIDEWLLNAIFIEQFEEIHVEIEGYLTRFELEILEHIASVCKVCLYVEVTKYNKNYYDVLLPQFAPFTMGKKYAIEINSQNVSSQDAQYTNIPPQALMFDTKIAQCRYLFTLLQNEIARDITPEKIGVILCDESDMHILKLFDTNRNLNFSMGEGYKESVLAKSIYALLKLDPNSKESLYRAESFFTSDTLQAFQAMLKADIESFLSFFRDAYFSTQDTEGYLAETLYFIESAREHFIKINNGELLKLLYDKLCEYRSDDIGGGRITCSGVLESRGMEYDTVIVLGMNEGTFPKASQKDIFLNSSIKKHCGIPTPFDRESLQKNYIHHLIKNSKKTIFCFVENEESMRSSVIEEFECDIEEIVIPKNEAVFKIWDETINEHIDLSDVIFSFTMLQCFLECKRKFYLRYIAKIKEPQKDDLLSTSDIGDITHTVLEELYKQAVPTNKEEYKALFYHLGLKKTRNNHQKIEWIGFCDTLEQFFETETQRISSGIRPMYLEKEFTVEILGVRFKGKIDRIDINGDSYELIDYKTKKTLKIDTAKNFDKSSDFQLEIYYLAGKELLGSKSVVPYYYDLRSGALLQESMLESKLEVLEHHIAGLKNNATFERCEKKSTCRYCPYDMICN